MDERVTRSVITRRAALVSAAVAGMGVLAACGTSAPPLRPATPFPTPLVVSATHATLPAPLVPPTVEMGSIRTGGHIVEARTADSTGGFNPVAGGGFGQFFLFDGLVYIDPFTLQPMPALASGWDVSPDGLTYTFTMRDGVKWHDGTPCTATDVAFSYGLYANPTTGSVRAAALAERAATVEARDTRTVVVTLKDPVVTFLMQHANLGIVPRHLLSGMKPEEIRSSDFSTRRPVGTGPFVMDSVRFGESFTLRSNPAYFRGAPAVARYSQVVARDYAVVLQRLKTGEVDAGQLAPDAHSEASRQPNLNVTRYGGAAWTCFGFNLDAAKGPAMFRDPQVRRALCHAVNREALVAAIDDGLGVVAHGIIPPDIAWAYRPEAITARYDYDPTKAAAMLDTAGWRRGADGVRERNGTRLAFNCYTATGGKNTERYLLAMQQQLVEIGVAMEPRFEAAQSLTARIRTTFDFDTFLYTYEGMKDADLSFVFASGQHGRGGFNSTGYANPRVDALLARALYTRQREERAALYVEAQNLILADAPALILGFPQQVAATNKRIRNFVYTAVVSPTFNAHQWHVTEGK